MNNAQRNQVLIESPVFTVSDRALLKAIFLGLDAKAMAQAYVGPGIDHVGDKRIADRMVADALARGVLKAHRAGRPDIADLLVPGKAKVSRARPKCSLDDFLSEPAHAHWRNFSVDQQMEAFLDVYPDQATDTPISRPFLDNLDAVDELVNLPERPTPDSPLAAWLTPPITATLKRQQVHTLEGLCRFCLLDGWWNRLSRVGGKKASIIVTFVRTLPFADRRIPAVTPTDHPSLPAVILGTLGAVVAPLERLRATPALSGRDGENRSDNRCTINANDDLDAIGQVLARHQGSSNTWLAYRKELERLLLWAIFEKNKALSSLNHSDAQDYVAFMLNPLPKDRWLLNTNENLKPKGEPLTGAARAANLRIRIPSRFSEHWRPFERPLSPESAQHALRILKAAFNFLTRTAYLATNPFQGLLKPLPLQTESPTSVVPKIFAQRFFTPAAWKHAEAVLVASTETPDLRRERSLMLLGVSTGLRASEIARATTNNMARADMGDEVSGYFLNVLGKGNKTRKVFVPEWLADVLVDHLRDRDMFVGRLEGGAWDFYSVGACALIGALNRKDEPETSLTAMRIYTLSKASLERIAQSLKTTNPEAAALLLAGSTHWLRHTFATRKAASGVPITLLQADLGHKDINTTSAYIHVDDTTRANVGRMTTPRPEGL